MVLEFWMSRFTLSIAFFFEDPCFHTVFTVVDPKDSLSKLYQHL